MLKQESCDLENRDRDRDRSNGDNSGTLTNDFLDFLMEDTIQNTNSDDIMKKPFVARDLTHYKEFVNRYSIVKEITLVSDYPFYWVNFLNIGTFQKSEEEYNTQHNQLTKVLGVDTEEEELKKILANRDISEVYRDLSKKFEKMTRYYNYVCPSMADKTEFSDYQKTTLFNTYWSCWDKFLSNRNYYFYIMNKSTGVLFCHDTEFINSLLSQSQ